MIKRLCSLMISLLFCTAVSADKPYVISYFEHPHIEPIKQALQKAYMDIGINVKFVAATGDRSIHMLEDGLVDAEVVRARPLIKQDTKAVIAYPLTQADAKLYCQHGVVCDETVMLNPDTLTGALHIHWQYVMAHYGEQLATQYVNISTYDQLGSMLNKDRIKYIFLVTLQDVNPDEFKTMQNKKLFTVQGMHVVHKKHQALIPKLGKALEKYWPRQLPASAK